MGENMSNPTFQNFLDYMKTTLDYQNKSGSINIYMAHGGSNFGWSMGEYYLHSILRMLGCASAPVYLLKSRSETP
jgi:hypothetical protein